jgi:hypothetical protein
LFSYDAPALERDLGRLFLLLVPDGETETVAVGRPLPDVGVRPFATRFRGCT